MLRTGAMEPKARRRSGMPVAVASTRCAMAARRAGTQRRMCERSGDWARSRALVRTHMYAPAQSGAWATAEGAAHSEARAEARDSRLSEVLVGKLPVDDLPPRLDVGGARVAVVDLVGVLPLVARQDRLGKVL